MSDRFRRRWLPKALPAEAALDRLASWQRSTQKIVTLHHAYIAGENDAEGDVHAVCDALEERRLMVHVNIVRYNPHDPARHGVEPPEGVIERNAAIYRRACRTLASSSSRGWVTMWPLHAGCSSDRKARFRIESRCECFDRWWRSAQAVARAWPGSSVDPRQAELQ